MQASSVSVLLTIRTSLSPTRPLSVAASKNTSSRHGAPTTVVRISRIFTAPRFDLRSPVRVRIPLGHYFHHLHHAAILVDEDVAVDHVRAGEVDEPGAHLEVAGNRERARRDAILRRTRRVRLDLRRALAEDCTDIRGERD